MSSPLKIGFDAKRLFHNHTGLGNYSRNLIRALARFYPDNSYRLYNPKPKSVDFRLEACQKEILPEGFWGQALPCLWRSKLILNQLRADGLDLYHGLSGELPWGIHRLKMKTVVTIHDLIFMRYPKLYSAIDRRIYLSKFKYAAHHADAIVAISEQTKADIVAFLGVPASKIDVLYQGCASVFKTPPSKEASQAVLKKYALPERFVLNVGTVEPRKNALTAVKAIKNTDVALVIAGKPTAYKAVLEAYISAHGLEKKVFFLENTTLEELAALYREAIAFIYPSFFEGFGIPIIEAMYSSTPVIVSRGSCFEGAAGPHSLYIDPEDDQSLSGYIRMLLENPSRRAEQAQKSLAFVQKFNDEAIAEQYMALYRRLVC